MVSNPMPETAMKHASPVDPELQSNYEPLRVIFALGALLLGFVLVAM